MLLISINVEGVVGGHSNQRRRTLRLESEDQSEHHSQDYHQTQNTQKDYLLLLGGVGFGLA